MSSALVGNANGRGNTGERGANWVPFRDLLGFDPFQGMRSSMGFDYDVSRTENGYDVEVPMPGFKPSQIEVTFKEGVLSVNGKNDRRAYARSFHVPEDVDHEKIEAKVEDGMLHLTLSRRPEAQPKRIEVK